MRKSQQSRKGKFWLGLGLGTTLGYLAYQQAWAIARVARADVQQTLTTHRNQGQPWRAYESGSETETYTVRHTVEDGIERVVYTPKQRRFETPIVMQHGMWHGAWCWAGWQALLAEWGWESHAHSLPGHAGSPVQRPLTRCTLDYYLAFLKDEMLRQPRRPILMGHSMGGALTQWYLKYVGDDLPAAVLVGPWVSHQMITVGSLLSLSRLQPTFVLEAFLSWDSTPLVNTPERAARAFISPNAIITPEALHAKLGPESILVLYQHNPPFWYPPARVQTPLLWIAGGADTLLPEPLERRSAAYYHADYIVVPGAGHDIMLEDTYKETARTIHEWLVKQNIP